jgi:5'-nucleotidase
MRVLITNDDGVASPGLHALARAVADAGHEVVVVAPSTDMSGAGASLGRLHADQHIDAEEVDLPGAEDVPAFAIAGPPGLCVLAARLGGFGDPPELVVSGINPGCNTGRAILHSGTVGAALTAANFGCRGVAISIDAAADSGNGGTSGPRHWDSAAALAPAAIAWLAGAEPTTVLNINVPDLPLDRIRGARWGELASFGTVRSAVIETPLDGGSRLQLELRPTQEELPPDTDTALVMAGYVAVTTVTGIQATEPVDPDPIVGAALGSPRTG